MDTCRFESCWERLTIQSHYNTTNSVHRYERWNAGLIPASESVSNMGVVQSGRISSLEGRGRKFKSSLPYNNINHSFSGRIFDSDSKDDCSNQSWFAIGY